MIFFSADVEGRGIDVNINTNKVTEGLYDQRKYKRNPETQREIYKKRNKENPVRRLQDITKKEKKNKIKKF